ncbi:MAG TPA: hypothetical protein EYO72_05645, partial [Marine Group III euryarchaeote]|nr:hypothetical protein [Marine Group III euryarchaeote]
FTEAPLSHMVCLGHMVANYGLPSLTPTLLDNAIEASYAEGLYFHKKGMKKSDYRKWKEHADERRIKVFSQADYNKRDL